MPDRGSADLIETLRALAQSQRLEAAHCAEFVPNGVAVPPEVRAALESAVAEGIAIGLTMAIDLLDRSSSSEA